MGFCFPRKKLWAIWRVLPLIGVQHVSNAVMKVFFIGVILMLTLTVKGHSQLITIEEVIWTNAVTPPSIPNRYLDSIPLGHVGVWIKAHCQAAAWETVKENGSLPIRYKWFKRSGGAWSAKGVDAPDDRFNQNENAEPDSLTNPTQRFYWYSWCLRKPPLRMSRGIWKVVITTAENMPLAEAEIVVTPGHD